jgi:hypothetical protein
MGIVKPWLLWAWIMGQSILRSRPSTARSEQLKRRSGSLPREESIVKLQKVFGLLMPIADRISALAERYRERLYEDLTD